MNEWNTYSSHARLHNGPDISEAPGIRPTTLGHAAWQAANEVSEPKAALSLSRTWCAENGIDYKLKCN